jgi:two-component system response regulator PilR (NtrC family)
MSEEDEPSGEFEQPANLNLDPVLVEKEKEVIIRALETTRYNKTAAAKLLGISFRQLRYRIKKLGIE